MGEAKQQRRVVLVAEPGNGLRRVTWRGAWQSEEVASASVERLDTLSVSAQISDLAGVLPVEGDGPLVIRGGLIQESSAAGRYWREALWLSAAEFERLRFNPFRALPATPPIVSDDLLEIRMSPQAEYADITAEDDEARLEEIRNHAGELALASLDTVLAAMLDADHALVTGSTLSLRDIELMILLLPPSLRSDLTFHSFALSMPQPPVPRLVATQVREDWMFPEHGVFGHRLPGTAQWISMRARNVASELVALLDSPARLGEVHACYEAFVARRTGERRELLDEAETVVRFARLLGAAENGEAGAGLRVLVSAAGADASSVDPSFTVLLDLYATTFPAPAIGSAVVDLLRNGVARPIAPLRILEWFVERRERDAVAFEAFRGPFQQLPLRALPHETDEVTRELRLLVSTVRPPAEAETDREEDATEGEPLMTANEPAVATATTEPLPAAPPPAPWVVPPEDAPYTPRTGGAKTDETAASTDQGEPEAEPDPDSVLPRIEGIAVAGAENRRKSPRRRLVPVAAGVVVLGVVVSAGILVQSGDSTDPDRGAPAGLAAEMLAAETDADPTTSNSAAPTAPGAGVPSWPSNDPGVALLTEARAAASASDWSRVLELLSGPAPENADRFSFSYDSLAARAALNLAGRFAAGESRHAELLAQAFDRADRALASVAPFARRADQLRLMRAEACMAGLNCDGQLVLGDLVLAARSASPEVSVRANALLGGPDRDAQTDADADTIPTDRRAMRR